jgi:hypothetical protein
LKGSLNATITGITEGTVTGTNPSTRTPFFVVFDQVAAVQVLHDPGRVLHDGVQVLQEPVRGVQGVIHVVPDRFHNVTLWCPKGT